MRRLPLIILLAAATPWLGTQKLSAQRMGGAHFSAGRFGSNAVRFNPGSNFASFPSFNRGGFGRYSFYPLAWGDPFYADYLSSGYPVASQPPIIFMQAPYMQPPAADSAPAQTTPAQTKEVQPLMIERQGDRYVRVDADDESGAEIEGEESTPLSSRRTLGAPARAATAQDFTAAVLVFRDGHREEISEYTIVGNALYARGSYYTNGSWIRKIELSSLDLAETLASNQSRGVLVRLPASPNEVIVGP